MQIKAGLKKEFTFVSRTMRLFGIIITVILLAIVDPLMMKAMSMFTQFMSTQMEKYEEDATEAVDSFFSNGDLKFTAAEDSAGDFGAIEEALDAVSEPDLTFGYMTGVSDISNTALLVIVLVMIAAAGGEQKKRSIIIPNCEGLTPTGYAIPKFIFYPTLVFCLTAIGTVVSYFVSKIAFGGSLPIESVLLTAAFTGLYMAFIVTLHLTIGICTGHPGMSAAVCYIGAALIPLLLSGFKVDKFNPFTVRTMALTLANGGSLSAFDNINIIISLVGTVVLIAVCILLTLAVLNIRKIDNAGDQRTL